MKSEQDGQKTHKNLDAWNMAMDLAAETYSITNRFPREELFGLVSQIRRAAVSIPSNIAEGAARNSRKEYIQFLYVALGSVAELETQLLLALRLKLFSSIDVLERVERVRQLLLGLLRFLKRPSSSHHA
ncbi:MAG TPA: four helix bundle protein [Nitrospira sp.]|nr:four helix bundle protein [Nitrospira sp.]